MLNVQGNLGISVLVQQEKARVAVHHHFLLRSGPAGQDVVQGLANLVAHGDQTAAALGLGLFHIPLAVPGPDQLVIHPDAPVVEVQIRHGQTAELADPVPSSTTISSRYLQ